jgi:outer membrane protein OmpA-like peptidoglycan-associated protein
MRTIYTLLVLFFLGNFAQAQLAQIEKADKLYNLLSYSEAIPLYESVLNEGGGSKGLVSLKLAKCYYNFGDMESAYRYFNYSQTQNAEFSADDCFAFAQCLKQLGEYAQSDKWMKKYESLNADALSVKDFNKNLDYLKKINADQKHFEISTVGFNSSLNDFGGYEFKKSGLLLILSDRNNAPISRIYGWNQMNFLDFMLVSNIGTTEMKVKSHKSGNSKFHEGPLCFSKDETRVYYTTDNSIKSDVKDGKGGIQNLILNMAEVEPNGTWTSKKELKINSKEYSVGHPTLSVDGKWIYFVSDMPGGFGGADIYMAEILQDGEISKPINLGPMINTEKQEMFPWISSNGQLFFSSNGLTGLGGLDIFVAQLNEGGQVKAVKHTGPEINSSKDDFGLIFMTDGVNGYFSSNRDGGKGNDDIYSFKMIVPFKFSVQLNGLVTDSKSGEILKGAEVALLDENGNVVATVMSDEKGHYNFELEPGKNYSVAFSSSGYTDETKKLDVNPSNEDLTLNAELSKVPTFGVVCKVTDAESGSILQGAQVTITVPASGNGILAGTTNEEGRVDSGLENVKIGDQLKINVTISKEGYLTKTVDVTLNITQPGVINIHEMMDASIGKMEVGVDLATLIDIKPIYFDLGKSLIRKDAAKELDKIVKVMNDYPTMVVELGSHTDCRGSIASNSALSDRRAKASAEYIKARITNPERIYGKGYGESQLKVDCPCEGTVKSTCPESEHQKNRRTEFLIIKM